MSKYRLISTALLFVSLILPLKATAADTILIVVSRDNTLIEDPQGAFSNGSGPYLFAGRTNQQANNLRRGLIHFDVASALPAGSRIRSVQLFLYLSKNQGFTGGISLHRVINDWGQGISSATGGSGAPAALDDATWLHTFYPDFFWATMGGDYVMDASAVMNVGPDIGSYTWESKKMAEDVQSWLMNPGENFGWMLIGDENTPQSVMRFSSREVTCSDVALSTEVPPILMVTYK